MHSRDLYLLIPFIVLSSFLALKLNQAPQNLAFLYPQSRTQKIQIHSTLTKNPYSDLLLFIQDFPQDYPWIQHWKDKKGRWHHDYSKEHFFCRGKADQPYYKTYEDGKTSAVYYDCWGGRIEHGFVFVNGQPWFAPILVQLCNAIEKSSQEPLSIIQGHCCPQHLSYIHPKHSRTDRFLMGARTEIRFENRALTLQEAWQVIQTAYDTLKDPKISSKFMAQDSQFWKNQELLIHLFHKENHLHADIQVLYDRETRKTLPFNWKSYRDFLRH